MDKKYLLQIYLFFQYISFLWFITCFPDGWEPYNFKNVLEGFTMNLGYLTIHAVIYVAAIASIISTHKMLKGESLTPFYEKAFNVGKFLYGIIILYSVQEVIFYLMRNLV